MKKILVIFTGGTIGSKIQDSTIDVDESTGYLLLRLFKERYNNDVDFDTIQPINILSENCTPIHWQKLCEVLNNVNTKLYDGIVITYGTDTLPYTSALLSFLYHYIDIPIVITGSNFALGDKRCNGIDNFFNSVSFIINSGMHGVYTIYQNNNGKNIIYLASRLREADSYNDQFLSYGGVNLGEIIDGYFVINKNKINPTYGMLAAFRERILHENIIFKNLVFAIKPYPGLNYNYFNLAKKPKAILHCLYHSGTACIGDNVFSLPQFINKCIEDGIDFYLISFKNLDSDLYITSKELLELGAVPLQNISFEAAYAKLNIAYNQNVLSPEEFMRKELFFEFLPK